MSEKPSLIRRWSVYRPSKAAWFWSCVASVAGTVIIGFTWGGWVTGATAIDRAEQAAQAAEAQLTANLCVSRFEKGAGAAAELADLKNTEFWQREDFISKGPWLKLPGMDRPIHGAASLCVDRLLSAKLGPEAPFQGSKG